MWTTITTRQPWTINWFASSGRKHTQYSWNLTHAHTTRTFKSTATVWDIDRISVWIRINKVPTTRLFNTDIVLYYLYYCSVSHHVSMRKSIVKKKNFYQHSLFTVERSTGNGVVNSINILLSTKTMYSN